METGGQMSLVNEQAIFFNHVCMLRAYAVDKGFIVTGRELGRTKEQQEIYVKNGLSKTSNSQHINNTAIDLYFFKMKSGKAEVILEKKELQDLGDYWVSLDRDRNQWGGNWKFLDCPHFERKV
jgi:peptidoglycan L-alanyl-D-glutamate endopeptidase CwlK